MLPRMRITKHSHACVRLDDAGRSLLIDPGIWASPEVYEDVDDVLVTHEHMDHLDVEALTALAARRSSLRVHAPAPVTEMLAALGDAVITVVPGDAVVAGGFEVQVVGGRHADIYDSLPGCVNVGFVVDGSVYHPGDALVVPDQQVTTLLLPVSGPWLKLAEAIDFARAVSPVRAYAIHDALLSPEGAAIVDRWIAMKSGTDYARLETGAGADV
jgi:L-ascorbate metabolism protein UlaG (beta-lactamase superfamily)